MRKPAYIQRAWADASAAAIVAGRMHVGGLGRGFGPDTAWVHDTPMGCTTVRRCRRATSSATSARPGTLRRTRRICILQSIGSTTPTAGGRDRHWTPTSSSRVRRSADAVGAGTLPLLAQLIRALAE